MTDQVTQDQTVEEVSNVNVESQDAEHVEAPQSSESINQAKENGWVDKNEWNGDPNQWVDHEKFLDRNINGLRQQNDRLKQENYNQKKEIADFKDTIIEMKKEFAAFNDRDLNSRSLSLDEQIKRAEEDLDVQALKSLMQQKINLENEKNLRNNSQNEWQTSQEPVNYNQQQPAPLDSRIIAWENDPQNSWIFGNSSAADRMRQLFAANIQDPNVDQWSALQQAEMRVKGEYSNFFSNQRNPYTQTPTPTTNSNLAPRAKEKTLANMKASSRDVVQKIAKAARWSDAKIDAFVKERPDSEFK